MATLQETIEELADAGYGDDFFAVPTGLRSAQSGKTYSLEELAADAVSRIDEDADPAGQVIVYALRGRDDGAMGTFVAAFGPAGDETDAAILQQLSRLNS